MGRASTAAELRALKRAGRPGDRRDARFARAEERRLIARARAGDTRALERLLVLVSGPAYRFGRGFCGEPEAARDVVQSVLLAIARTLRDFRGDSSLVTWAYTVARNACARQRRRRAGAPAHVESLDASSPSDAHAVADVAEDPHRALERAELGRAIERAIASLPPAHREVLVLRDIEGLTAAEAGKVLGLGERAVKSRLHRARLALRERLAPWAAERGPVREPTRRPVAAPPARARSARCPETVRLVSRYLEGDLDRVACERLAAHVSGCFDCGTACETLRAALVTCRSWRGRTLPPEVKQEVRDALRRLIASR